MESDLMNGIAPLEEKTNKPAPTVTTAQPDAESPAEEFNRITDIEKLVELYHWKKAHKAADGNQHWTRPGKDGGTSATTKDGLFYVFTSTDEHFEARKGYNAFQTYARLEHGGDESAAAVAILKRRTPQVKYRGPKAVAARVNQLTPDSTAEIPQSEPEVLRPSQLLSYDTKNDPNCLAGDRWLCAGGSALLTGPSGVGKSSMGIQFTISAALGEPFFGIRFVRPLRCLVLQAENDRGDAAEEFTGVVQGMGWEHRAAEIEENIVFRTESALTGQPLVQHADYLIQKYKIDLLIMDPFMSYLGGNVSDQETCSVFLRNWLTPVLQARHCAILLIHHHGKPKDPERRRGMVSSDHSYAGIGSSEVTNWTRATLNLTETQDGLYQLRASKRGKRAGLEDSAGDRCIEVYLKHSERGICWERADPPTVPANAVVEARLDEICKQLGKGAHRYTDIEKITQDVLGCKARSTATKFMSNHVFKLLRKTPGTGLWMLK